MAAEKMELLQGTLDVLVLRTLVWGTMHGFEISRRIRTRTEGVIAVEYAPLYKALHRLEGDGAVSAEWGISDNGRRARYYKLTARGRTQLRTAEGAWRRYAGAVFRVLEEPA